MQLTRHATIGMRMPLWTVIPRPDTFSEIMVGSMEKEHPQLRMQAHVHAERHPAVMKLQQQMNNYGALHDTVAHRAENNVCCIWICSCACDERTNTVCTMPHTRDT